MATKDLGQGPDWKAMLHRVLLAAVGAVALAQEEVETFVTRLVARGALAEKDGKVMLKDIMQKRKELMRKGATTVRSTLEGAVEGRIERLFGKLHLASKRDVESLTERIEELNAKLDAMGGGRKRGK